MPTDKELRANALTLWANHIETGKVTLSEADVVAQNKCRPPREQHQLPSLTAEQRALVARLRQLAILELKV